MAKIIQNIKSGALCRLTDEEYNVLVESNVAHKYKIVEEHSENEKEVSIPSSFPLKQFGKSEKDVPFTKSVNSTSGEAKENQEK